MEGSRDHEIANESVSHESPNRKNGKTDQIDHGIDGEFSCNVFKFFIALIEL